MRLWRFYRGTDWDKVASTCCRCGHDLRGVASERCAECGAPVSLKDLWTTDGVSGPGGIVARGLIAGVVAIGVPVVGITVSSMGVSRTFLPNGALAPPQISLPSWFGDALWMLTCVAFGVAVFIMSGVLRGTTSRRHAHSRLVACYAFAFVSGMVALVVASGVEAWLR